MKRKFSQVDYQDGLVEGYWQALQFFIKAYRNSMKEIEKEYALIKNNRRLDRKKSSVKETIQK